VWAREPIAGQRAVALLNSSFDPATDLNVALLTFSSRLRVFDMRGREVVVAAGRADGPYRYFQLPTVEPWSMRLLVTAP
jgi:hypothetical protein